MSNFVAVLTTVNSTVELEFDTLIEYSEKYNAVVSSVLAVVFFFNKDGKSTLTENEYKFLSGLDVVDYSVINFFERGYYDSVISKIKDK